MLNRDNKGIALPGEVDPLPWNTKIVAGVEYIMDARGAAIGYERETIEFQVHAANHHRRLAEVVRQLVFSTTDIDTIIGNATVLWAEMMEDATDSQIDFTVELQAFRDADSCEEEDGE